MAVVVLLSPEEFYFCALNWSNLLDGSQVEPKHLWG